MSRQNFGLWVRRFLQCAGYPCVKLLSLGDQQTLIRGILHQRMFKHVALSFPHSAAINEPRVHELIQLVLERAAVEHLQQQIG